MPLVMFIDDSQTVLSAINMVTSEMSIETKMYIEAQSALDDINGGVKPDLIVTDLNMPTMNGLEFLSKIRDIDSMAKVPVLILTTESKPELKEIAKSLHATGWILKPFNPKQFEQALRRVLRIR